MVRADVPKNRSEKREPHIANARILTAGDPVSEHQNSSTASLDLLPQD